jgi:hypothetical protein
MGAPKAIGMALGVALVACGPSVSSSDADDDDQATTAASSVGSAGSSATGSGSETGSVEDTLDPGSTTIDDHDPCGDGCCGFYGGCPGDWGPVDLECDIATQDCPQGQKCAPWDNVGDGEWNATKCTPLDPNPGGVGDPCFAEGSAISGIDDCEAGLLCFGVDSTTNEGLCVELCLADVMQCSSEGTSCIVQPGEVMGTCLAPCDPLEPECEAPLGCYPFVAGEAGCAPDGSGEAGLQGDACVWATDCAPGFTCAAPDDLPDCTPDFWGGCCTQLCDPSAAAPCGEDSPLVCTTLSDDPLVGACTL